VPHSVSASIVAMPDRFIPSVQNALRARSAIHTRLNESLRHVFEQCAGHVGLDAVRADALLRRVDSGERLPPALFGDFFLLVDAIEHRTLEQVRTALDKILRHADGPPAPETHVRPFSRRGFSSQEEAEFRRQFVCDSLRDEQLGHLDESSERETLAQFERAIDKLRRHAPRTFAEIRTLACEIVPAHGSALNGLEFDGCSSLERWGSILVNARRRRTDLELSEVITHESAHNALFAMAPVNFHVENDPEERYQSPLRLDPRPMNGIYHATFVLARMCFAMREVAASPTADAPLRQEALRLASASASMFADGYELLVRHARYTPEGQEIMRDTARYMESSAK
jgi:HEXXH motif-containing protein